MKWLEKVIRKIRAGYLLEIYQELRWMYQYVRRYRLSILFYIVAGILGTGMTLGSSVVSKHLIDAVIGKQVEGLAALAALMAGMAAGSVAMQAVVSRISAKITVSVQNEMRAELYNQILYTRWEELQTYSTGDLLNRLNSDMNIVSGNVISWLPSLVTKAVQFLGTLGIILYYDPTMAVFALISAPVTLILSKVLMEKMRRYNREMREISSDMMAFQNDSFQNLQTLKAFGLMTVFGEKMNRVQENYKEKMMDYNKFSIFVASYMSAAGMAVSYLCFGWSIYRLWGGYITMGTMTLFMQLASRLAASFQALVRMVPTLIGAATSAGRLMVIAGLEKEVEEDAQAEKLFHYNGPIEVACEGVKAAYPNGDLVFERLNFSVSSGQVAAVIGPSGEGKTTLIRLLLGMLKPEAGSAGICWGEHEFCNLSAATRRYFSYVPQGNTIFMGTIEDNLRLVKPNATRQELEDALKAACAWEFVKELKGGLQYYVGEHGTGLSEGQAQRIAIARAVLRDAPIMLLDEATSALDMETERRVLEQIVGGNSGKMCIVTTHRASVLSMCDKIYEVRKRKVYDIKNVKGGEAK